MNKREMEKFKKVLMNEAQHYSKGIKSIGNDAMQGHMSENTGDLTGFAEAGTDNNDRETKLRLASGESHLLEEVAEALERIDEGTYGECVDCEEDIPKKRLEVFPAAKRCVKCKEKYEKETQGRY